MDYNGKMVLAPMVRVGTHPMRLLAAGYGADIVYSEELVDKRVVASVRRVNDALGTVDFVDKGGEQGGRIMFRTTPDERPRLVFQLGTADGSTALAAAQIVAADVACVDVNMGCPKQFSLQGGMGAALLRKPEAAEDILKTLRRNLQLPVSCKIRLLDDPRDTVELARRLAACGISALAVHGRTTQQRPRDPASWEPIRQVVDALAGLPVIANGDVLSYGDAQRVRQETGCAAAMVARGAMWNASVFRPQGFLPLDEVQREYVRLSLRWGNALPNTKYCLKEMADAPPSFAGRRGGPRSLVGHEANTAFTRARDERQLCELMGLGEEPPYQDLGTTATGFSSETAQSRSQNGGRQPKQPKQAREPKQPKQPKQAREPKGAGRAPDPSAAAPTPATTAASCPQQRQQGQLGELGLREQQHQEQLGEQGRPEQQHQEQQGEQGRPEQQHAHQLRGSPEHHAADDGAAGASGAAGVAPEPLIAPEPAALSNGAHDAYSSLKRKRDGHDDAGPLPLGVVQYGARTSWHVW